jgi:hypothetical protein
MSMLACGAGDEAMEGGDDAGAASVSFVGLEDGATVTSPLEVCLEVSGVTIEPSGEIVEGAGHHHIIVDPGADEKAAYSVSGMMDPIAKDETHIHMGDGSTCTTLELSAGEHELMAVVADGAHIPMDPPVTASVKVTVGE